MPQYLYAAVQALLLVAYVAFGPHLPQSTVHLVVLLAIGAALLVLFVPMLAGLLARLAGAGRYAPSHAMYSGDAAAPRLTGAPGTPGAALPRAPSFCVRVAA